MNEEQNRMVVDTITLRESLDSSPGYSTEKVLEFKGSRLDNDQTKTSDEVVVLSLRGKEKDEEYELVLWDNLHPYSLKVKATRETHVFDGQGEFTRTEKPNGDSWRWRYADPPPELPSPYLNTRQKGGTIFVLYRDERKRKPMLEPTITKELSLVLDGQPITVKWKELDLSEQK